MYKKIALLFIVCSIHAQTTGKISGVVYDSNQKPLTGATVSIVGTSNGTFTDDQGFYYIINLYPGTYTLKFNMIGFKTVTVNEVVISVNKTTRIDVDMEQTVIDGQEVIVTASKISTKKDQSGTIKNISEIKISDFDGVDIVCDLNGISNDPSSELNSKHTWQINYKSRVKFAELSKKAGVLRFIFNSTCSVYGFNKNKVYEDEDWKEIILESIENNRDKYFVSNYGRIKNNRNKIINGYTDEKGYKRCSLGGDGKHYRIHILVAKHFIVNPNNKTMVNHKDGNKENNNVDNLEWATNQENSQHAVNTGLHNRSKPLIQYDIYMNKIKEFDSPKLAGEELNICHKKIAKCCRGTQKTLEGFIFKYIE